MKMVKYYKITNKNETHYGFKYQDGLNILKEKFNNDENAYCVPGGFYFTTKEFIHEFYEYGIYLREIELPINDPEFKMVKDPSGNKWRANKIILGNKYSLLDPEIYITLGIKMMDMDYASAKGYEKLLQLWKDSGLELKYSNCAMDWASENGHKTILQWWKDSGLGLKYSYYAMDWISANGYEKILQWWKDSGLELKYSDDAMDWASENGHEKILQ